MFKKAKYLRNMKPPRMWIDGSCYNIQAPDKSIVEHHKLFNIISKDDGKLETTFRMPNVYYKKLREDPMFSLTSFAERTKTKLDIPENGKDGNISITGDDYDCVANARDELHTFLNKIRKTCVPQQFISIPTLNQEVKNNFVKFKEELLNSNVKIEGLEESVFQKPEKLHLTIIVMSLLDDIEKEQAVNVLKSCKEEVINKVLNGKNSLKIRLKGLDTMQTNLKKVNVLYTKAKFEDESDGDMLQTLANEISDYFYEKGLCKEHEGSVKIHVTLINTKYRHKRNAKRKRLPVDATYIVDKYKDYDFGVSNFDEVHLSLMSSKGDDGFYEPIYVVKL